MSNDTLLATDHPLSATERRALRCIAGIMIPASAQYCVPGADDETIFADILGAARAGAPSVKSALAQLDALADGVLAGGVFADLEVEAQRALCERFRTSGSPLVGVLVALVTQCYYRDDRVMRSLDMEPRPPFPRGFEVEDGDWSLLDPVRARPKLYRDA